VSKNPELDIMHWVMRRVPIWRMTNRHAAETPNHSPSISHTKDGRWFITHGMGARDLKNLVPLLGKYGMQADLQPPPPDAELKERKVPGSQAAHARRGAAIHSGVDLCGHAVARGAGRRPAVGAAAQAA
jgi:hypothetical protein